MTVWTFFLFMASLRWFLFLGCFFVTELTELTIHILMNEFSPHTLLHSTVLSNMYQTHQIISIFAPLELRLCFPILHLIMILV